MPPPIALRPVSVGATFSPTARFMEFCGSLPGDDRGEDGYSLSGEARDAATSRNGLNENRKSVAEMIQECFDSIENNGDTI